MGLALAGLWFKSLIIGVVSLFGLGLPARVLSGPALRAARVAGGGLTTVEGSPLRSATLHRTGPAPVQGSFLPGDPPVAPSSPIEERILSWLWVVPAAWVVLFAFVPETEVDCLLYHLAAPDQFFASHALVRDRLSHAFRLPLPVEMLYGFSVACGTDAPAKLLHAAAGVGCAMAVALLAGGGPAARLAGWLFAMSGWSVMLMLRAKNDLVALLWMATALLATDSGWRDATHRGRPRFAPPPVAWWLFGCGVAAKYTYAPFGLVLAGWGWLRYGVSPQAGWLRAMPLAALPLLPWWARNHLHFGNFLWFGFTGWLPPVDQAPGGVAEIARNVIEPFAAPGTGTWPGAVRRIAPRWILAAPALALAGSAALRAGAGQPARRLGLAALLLAILHARFGRADRFGLPADLLLAVVGGLAVAGAAPRLPPRARGGGGAVLVLLGLVPLVLRAPGDLAARPLASLVGLESPDAFLARWFGELDDARRAVAARHPRRLLLAGDLRAYRFGVPVTATLTHGIAPLGWSLAREAHDPGEAAKRVRQLGVTMVAYNFVTAFYQKEVHDPYPWTDRMLRVWDGFVRTRLAVVREPARSDHGSGGFYLYKILARPGAPQPLIFYLPGGEGMLREVWLAERRQDAPAVTVALDRLNRLLPGVGAVHDYTAWHAYAFGRWQEAYEHIRVGTTAGMVNDENWVLLGATALKLGRYEEAERAYLRARVLYPYDVDERDRDLAVVTWSRGEGLRRAGRWPEAEGAYRACLTWSAIMRPGPNDAPSIALAHLRLAETLARLGRTPEGREEYDAAVALLPGVPRSPEGRLVGGLLGR